MFKEKFELEEPPKEEQKPLSLEEAQKEANLIRGFLNKHSLKDGETPSFENSRKAYEYGENFINELKEAVKKEPESIKGLYKLGRIFHTVGKAFGLPVAIIDEMLASVME